MDLGLIKRVFPDVPWVFLYRNPVEVMVSQMEHRSAHLIPGVIEPALFGLATNAATLLEPEQYCAVILSRTCEAALRQHEPGRSMLVNYSRLPEAVWTTVFDLFQVHCAPDGVERLSDAAKFYSKNPSIAYREDSEEKRHKATDRLLQATSRWLTPVYEQLEAAAR
jgi:hypothetical protein